MKKHIITLLVFLVSFGAFAQKDRMKQKEKLKALKIAHITEQLDLTTKEAEDFWPIYNAHEDKLKKLRDGHVRKKLEGLTDISEEEAKQILKDMQKMEQQKHDIESAFLADLSKVIPATKILKLVHAERSFKRKMIEEFRGRGRDRGPERAREFRKE